MKWITRPLWLAVLGVIALIISGTLLLSSAFLYLSPNLPPVESLRDVRLQVPLRVYSADGKLIGEFGEMRRTPIDIKDVPPLLIKAFLAAEDERFYQHRGVDLRGLMRAVTQLASSGSIQTGGSTITMQVAKNFFLSSERTFIRKFTEILLALQIERELSKEEILELYLNKIYLGNRAYGIAAAAQVYYGTSIDQLTLAQMAMVAGLPKAPSAFNPVVNPKRAQERRDWILQRMLKLDYITQQQYRDAVETEVSARHFGLNVEFDAPYVAEMARQEMLGRFGPGAYTEGYRAITTIDSHLQDVAQKAVIHGLLAYDDRHGYRGPEARLEKRGSAQETQAYWLDTLRHTPVLGGLVPAVVTRVEPKALQVLLADGSAATLEWQAGLLYRASPYISFNQVGPRPQSASQVASVGDLIRLSHDDEGNWQINQVPAAQAALIALNPNNGAIVALSGGFDFRQSKFNRATQAQRQPGSNFKPILYAAALAKGRTAATIINDAPLVFEDAGSENAWRPANDTGKFLGPIRLRQALYQSRNLVSIRLLRDIGIEYTVQYASLFGFKPQSLPHNLTLALGTYSATPMQMATAYAAFANGGYKIEPYLIEEVLGTQDSSVYQAQPATVCRQCDSLNAPDGGAENDDGSKYDNDNTRDTAFQRPANVAPRIMDEQTAYIMDSILKDVVRRGTARRALSLNRRDLAGKTGTTNGPTDVWFSGYHPDLTASVWMGFDNNTELGPREYGASTALPIWMDFMREALKNLPEKYLPQPRGVVSVLIDPETGERALPGQADAIFELFPEHQVPTMGPVYDSGSGGGSSIMPEDLF
jgi:penicillin-binding protein 1A